MRESSTRNILIGLAMVALAALACAETRSADELPEKALQFPVGLAVHPQGYALVVSSNFDLRYGSGTLQAIDLNKLAARVEAGAGLTSDHRDLIYDSQAVGIPSFGASVKLVASDDAGLAIVAARQNDQVILVDLEIDPSVPEGESPIKLSCWPGGTRPTGELAPLCDGTRNVLELDENDPFDLEIIEDPASASRPWAEREWTLAVSFLLSGNIVVAQVPPGRPDSEDVPRVLYKLDLGAAGTNDIARSKVTGLVYVTSRFNVTQSNPLHYFDPGAGEDASVSHFDMFNLVQGTETRGLAFAGDGLTVATVVRSPDMLVFVDTSPGDDGFPVNKILGEAVVGQKPSKVAIRGRHAFVTSAEGDTLYVVDTSSMRMIEISEEVCRGIFDIDFFDRGDLHWAVVSCFEDNVIAAVDVDPDSATFLQVVARVGELKVGD